jgi:hypothetical protein
MSGPLWIDPVQWRDLKPPAEVLKLGELPRAPEKILAATRALCVLTALRYQPVVDPKGRIVSTWCNINTSDAMSILRAPLPHWYDLADGRGRREMQANDYWDGLRAMKFPGWSKLGTMASEKAVIEWVAQGHPAVAVWKNTTPRTDGAGRILVMNGRPVLKPGHINPVVPTPAGRGGVHVTGAGGKCVQECPIQFSFGHHTPEVEFYGHL